MSLSASGDAPDVNDTAGQHCSRQVPQILPGLPLHPRSPELRVLPDAATPPPTTARLAIPLFAANQRIPRRTARRIAHARQRRQAAPLVHIRPRRRIVVLR